MAVSVLLIAFDRALGESHGGRQGQRCRAERRHKGRGQPLIHQGPTRRKDLGQVALASVAGAGNILEAARLTGSCLADGTAEQTVLMLDADCRPIARGIADGDRCPAIGGHGRITRA